MKILLNGNPCDTSADTLHALAAEHNASDRYTRILNGFQTMEDLPLKEGDQVFLIPKDTLPDRESLELMMAARHTPRVHEQVRSAHVAIAGLGGLGSNIAIMLARTGVGHLHLVDFDTVEPSNLNRQQYFVRQLGMRKTDALKQTLEDCNPYIKVTTEFVRVTADNAARLFGQFPIVCEAFDNPEAKAMLCNTLLSECPDTILVTASGMAGLKSSNLITTRQVMKRLYLCGDTQSQAEPGQGLMAPRVTVCAAHQANMILRLLTGETQA